jgi:hypothetical protein
MHVRLFGVWLLVAGTAGCAVTSAPSPQPIGFGAAGIRHDSHFPSPKDPWLYVSGSNNVVNAYDLLSAGNPLVLTISAGIHGPSGLKIDQHGRLYVSNGASATVTEYPFGETQPALTLSINNPVDTAVDPINGDLYVDTRANPPGIAVYLPHQKTPAKTIHSNLLVNPSQMVFDSAGTLYVTDNESGVLVIKPQSFIVKSLGLRNLDGCTTGIALDESTGDLFVSDCVGGLQVYQVGNPYPVRSLQDSFPADYLALGTVRKQLDLFAPDISSNTVMAYQADENQPFETIHTGSQNALGVAIKPLNVP